MRYLIFIVTITLFFSAFADGLYNNPESVTYDPLSQSYYVSNYGNGKIIRVDQDGNQSVFISELNENLGIYLHEETLYISCDNVLCGYDISSGVCHTTVELPAIYWLDGITADASGNLYIVDCAGQIFRLDTQFFTWEIFIDDLPIYTQDCVYDFINDRLLIVAWRSNSPIYAADISNPADVYEASALQSGYFDGITIDQNGNIYVSSHAQGGNIYQFQNDLTQPPSLISGSFNEPAGLFFDQCNSVLAVPDFANSTVDFIQVSLPASNNHIQQNQILVDTYPNPFNPQTTFSFFLPSADKITLSIYNSKGQLISKPVNRSFSEGYHSLSWNASDNTNSQLPSECYIYKLTAGKKITYGKILLMK